MGRVFLWGWKLALGLPSRPASRFFVGVASLRVSASAASFTSRDAPSPAPVKKEKSQPPVYGSVLVYEYRLYEKKPDGSRKKCFPSLARDDERPFWGLRHRMPQRAPMACPDRRRAHCHLPPRALPGAQPQQHGAQCAGQHHKQLCAPPTFLITRHQPCAPRGRVRRANASRFAHAFSRLRIALVPSTCSSFCSTHCSPACAACCTAPCKRRARELLQVDFESQWSAE
jgi:hypothetical protein